MLLKDAFEVDRVQSTKASDIIRQLALTGVAIIWIFKNDARPDHSQVIVPVNLYWPAAFMVFTLFLDLVQYVISARAWRKYANEAEATEKAKQQDPNLRVTVTDIPDAPRNINDKARTVYKAKHISIKMYVVL